MNRLIETFLAEDITGNQYRIERYQIFTRGKNKSTQRDELLRYKNTAVTYLGDDIYYIASIDTEVKKLSHQR